MELLGYHSVEMGFFMMSMIANIVFFTAIFALDRALNKQCDLTSQEQNRWRYWQTKYYAERKRSIAELKILSDRFEGVRSKGRDRH
jgi:hypothetical protein